MTRYLTLLPALALAACATAQQAAPAQTDDPVAIGVATIPAGASPTEVYLLYDQHRLQRSSQLERASSGLEALEAEGRLDELAHARNEILESADPDAMAPFLSDAQLRDLAAMSPEDRRMVFLMSLDPAFRPSRVEVRHETVTDARARLDGRGYFESPMIGEPGWRTGAITLVREASGWKVEEESWGESGSGEDDAPRGRLEVSGAVTTVDEATDMSSSRWASYGGGWGFHLHGRSNGYVLHFSNIPATIEPGDYPLADRPSIPGDADPATLEFPLSATFAKLSDGGGYDRTWDENVTGALIIEAVEAGALSGRFEFTAEAFIGPPVTVRGWFRNVRLP